MTLALQALPLLLLLAALGSGRVGPVGACLGALLAAVPAALVSQAGATDAAALAALLGEQALRGAFLAVQPVGVVAGGLLFHAALACGAADGAGPARPPTAARVFAVTLPLGGFLESVTGFAVGAVFALTALRGMGIGGPVAVALAVQALTLVPWGGLGPGTALGGALTGVPAQHLAVVAAWPNALWLLLLSPLLWSLSARAGVPVPPRERAVQAALLGLMAGLLLAANAALPFEVAGIVTAGPVAVLALLRADPPTGLRAGLRAAAPYLLLTACLLLARAWPAPPALAPFPDLPGFPLTHVAVVLWLVAGALLAARAEPWPRAAAALRRALRPALVMLLYVVLGRVLAGTGVAAALAAALADGLGALAPFAVPPMGLVSGIVTGSNVGANAALAPLQARLGEAAGLPAALAPGVHNFAGAAGAGMSIGVVAMLCGLAGGEARPAAVWRLLAPSLALVVGLGWGAMVALA
jgi:lactate permease